MSGQALPPLLIVDDARLFRELVRDGLQARFADLEIIEADGVAHGYRQASQRRPRLVLLDVSMPDGNGLDLARRIRDELPEIAVCVCSLNDEPELRQAAADSGAVGYISKRGDFWSDTEDLVRTVYPAQSGPGR